jgi:hypothetical protein
MKQHISYMRVEDATKITFHIITKSASTFISLLYPNLSQNNTETQKLLPLSILFKENIKSLSDMVIKNVGKTVVM